MTDLALGLMSGTSLDGIDAALIEVDDERTVRLVHFLSMSYDRVDREAIRSVLGGADAATVAALDVTLADRFAAAAVDLLDQAGVPASALSVVGSHGQTIWHDPGRASLQVGNGFWLAERLGVPVVTDFRGADIAAGGQGAPLVPMADAMLFAGSNPRVLLNIGGIANATWVRTRHALADLTAFDTGPGVAIIDGVTRMVDQSVEFDMDGGRARRGRAAAAVVQWGLTHPYFDAAPPKSTGRETFGSRFAQDVLDRVLAERASGDDAIATAVHIVASSIVAQIRRWLPSAPEVVVSGGGSRNPVLFDAICDAMPDHVVARFDDSYFNGDAKEAVAFAYLAWRTLNGLPGNVPSATGATGHRILGSVIRSGY